MSFFGFSWFESDPAISGTGRPARKKGVFVTRVRQTADMVGAVSDWPTEYVLDLGTNVLRAEWEKILRVAPYRRTARRSIVVPASGRFQLSGLNASTSTDSAQWVFTILEMHDGERGLHPLEPNEVWDGSDDTMGMSGYTVTGDEVRVFGVDPGTTLRVLVNHTPQFLDLLQTDDSIIDFPDGWEPILWMETAALCLMKGGREVQQAISLKQQAEGMRQELLSQESRRFMAGPKTLTARDSRDDWGSAW